MISKLLHTLLDVSRCELFVWMWKGYVMQNVRMSAVACGLEGAYDGGGVWGACGRGEGVWIGGCGCGRCMWVAWGMGCMGGATSLV